MRTISGFPGSFQQPCNCPQDMTGTVMIAGVYDVKHSLRHIQHSAGNV